MNLDRSHHRAVDWCVSQDSADKQNQWLRSGTSDVTRAGIISQAGTNVSIYRWNFFFHQETSALHLKPSVIVLSHSLVSNSLQPRGLSPTRLPCPWDFPGQDVGVGCHSLLQGIFPTQGSNVGLLHRRQILYHLSHQGSTINYIIFFIFFSARITWFWKGTRTAKMKTPAFFTWDVTLMEVKKSFLLAF